MKIIPLLWPILLTVCNEQSFFSTTHLRVLFSHRYSVSAIEFFLNGSVFNQGWCFGQVIDLGRIWEIRCPHTCNCQIAKFSDLPLHQWARVNIDNEEVIQNIFPLYIRQSVLKVSSSVKRNASSTITYPTGFQP